MLGKISAACIGFLCVFVFLSCTIVKHDKQAEQDNDEITFYFENDDFDAASYIADIWDSQIIPEIQENAEDLKVLLDLLQTDPEAAISLYGIRKEVTSPHCFVVKGSFPILSIDKESASGLLYFDISDLNGDDYCAMQIGPVIKKSAVRDALSFINFGDFSNQIEFANISREINFYIKENIVHILEDSIPAGSIADFYGVFILDDTGKILITPVELTIRPGE